MYSVNYSSSGIRMLLNLDYLFDYKNEISSKVI